MIAQVPKPQQRAKTRTAGTHAANLTGEYLLINVREEWLQCSGWSE